MKYKDMTKEEKREHLKPYRSLGGFIIFLSIFTSIIYYLTSALSTIISSLTKNEDIQFLIKETFMYGSIIYTYYLGYRTFIKKYKPKIIQKWEKKENNYIKIAISIILAFIVTRFFWILWEFFLDYINYNITDKTMEVGIVGIIYVVLLAPICEEVIFRGWLLKLMQNYGNIVAIIISSLTFGIFHMTFTQSIPAIFIGVVCSILAIKYKSLIPGIILHILTNAYSTLEEIVFNSQIKTTINNILLILALVIIIAYVFLHIRVFINTIKEICKSFWLLPKSISYMFFLLIALYTLFIDLNEVYHFIKIPDTNSIIEQIENQVNSD